MLRILYQNRNRHSRQRDSGALAQAEKTREKGDEGNEGGDGGDEKGDEGGDGDRGGEKHGREKGGDGWPEPRVSYVLFWIGVESSSLELGATPSPALVAEWCLGLVAITACQAVRETINNIAHTQTRGTGPPIVGLPEIRLAPGVMQQGLLLGSRRTCRVHSKAASTIVLAVQTFWLYSPLLFSPPTPTTTAASSPPSLSPTLLGLYLSLSSLQSQATGVPLSLDLILRQQTRLFHQSLVRILSSSSTSLRDTDEGIKQLLHDLPLWLPSLPIITSYCPASISHPLTTGAGFSQQLDAYYVDPSSVTEEYIASLLTLTVHPTVKGLTTPRFHSRWDGHFNPLVPTLSIRPSSMKRLREALDQEEEWSKDEEGYSELEESVAELDRAVERAIEEVEVAEKDLFPLGKGDGEQAIQELLDGILTLPENLSGLVDCYKQYEKSGGELQASSSLLSSLPTSPDSTAPSMGSDAQQRYIEEMAQLPSPEPALFPRTLAGKAIGQASSLPADRDPDSTDTEPEDVVRRYTGK
ncbi:hypothetical protein BJ684DRAFT_15846 [Piptocephalis cylindrospora]|uniref:Uncharacterized protein n=1 Tax=Piptocephalis cylindrospora TaxID=1907219 RepID=A0A4P9Y4J8_9FUNG|nr:hypothetical protein BJ684DRAFT_15846 [Piptocephalis cylindrospora]|eukprot:RKP13793.1 hypothetical protein BJ684DRAFT_15846 [Piptocephalis cylindrospora]